ncbi:DUF928 domain-containing protein [Calothrix sp. UHCC 0171]|uniref:DUF928 domain-containing protein n=1 Tax=Calothrix sp. UHCC 0171 TaxID=3110245 RepID=UPI002B21C5E5|nr:DUF928 domain-containing protein [Calothrix sp. UHCC 0171]MEA5573478.1 DUF928 domain-containing protein [Calothrix sp. UHCC 0171]
MAPPSEAKPAQTPKQKPNPSPSKTQRRKPFRFKLSNDGAPGNRMGAATRGCSSDNKKPPLTGLIPEKNQGLTVSDRPTFWFYVPYIANSTTPVEFKLTDFDEKEIYKQDLQLTNTPGIISITLPKNAPALELDQTYEWSLGINCDTRIDQVNGRIKRVKASAEVTKQLQANTGRDRLLVYAENSFWYETLTLLIELRRQNPQDEGLKADWEDLLTLDGVNLPRIVPEPIVSCCKPK